MRVASVLYFAGFWLLVGAYGLSIKLDLQCKDSVQQYRAVSCTWSAQAAIGSQQIILPFVDGLQWGADVPSTKKNFSGSFELLLPQSAGVKHKVQVAVANFADVARIGPLVGVSIDAINATVISAPAPVLVIEGQHRRRAAETKLVLASAAAASAGTGPLVGLDWEPWFTPHNFNWNGGTMTSEAIPSVGRYTSIDILPMLQHLAWIEAASIDFLFVDWSNNLWGKTAWAQRNPNVQEIVNATQLTMGVYASERARRLAAGDSAGAASVPKFAFLLGFDNGPNTTQAAIYEELDFIRDAMMLNDSVGIDSFVVAPQSDAPGAPMLPLAVIFDGSGRDHSTWSHPDFALRFMASQLQGRPTLGTKEQYWSWMDGAPAPVIARRPDGSAEAATATSAYFAGAGWIGAGAAGHAGGATLVVTVLSIWADTGNQGPVCSEGSPGCDHSVATGPSPANLSFVLVNQWNEFAGQANGQGYGPNHDLYVDSYSAELTNDMEPTDLAACAYRRPNTTCGGYGYRQLNLMGMVTRLLKEGPSAALGNSTVLLPVAPGTGAVIGTQGTVNVSWVSLTAESALAGAETGRPFDSPPVDGSVLEFTMDGVPVTPQGTGPGYAVLSLGNTQIGVEGDGWTRGVSPTILQAQARPGSGLMTMWPLSLQEADWEAGGVLVPARFELALHV